MLLNTVTNADPRSTSTWYGICANRLVNAMRPPLRYRFNHTLISIETIDDGGNSCPRYGKRSGFSKSPYAQPQRLNSFPAAEKTVPPKSSHNDCHSLSQ